MKPFQSSLQITVNSSFSLKEQLWKNIYLATDSLFFFSLCISSYLIDELFQETFVFWDLFEIFFFEDVVNQIWLLIIIRTENNKKGYIFQSLQFLHRILLDAGCIIHSTVMSETKKKLKLCLRNKCKFLHFNSLISAYQIRPIGWAAMHVDSMAH